MARKYYTLAIWDGAQWGPQFGDYNREVVAQERADSYAEYLGRHAKIIATGPKKADIEAAIAKLNEKES